MIISPLFKSLIYFELKIKTLRFHEYPNTLDYSPHSVTSWRGARSPGTALSRETGGCQNISDSIQWIILSLLFQQVLFQGRQGNCQKIQKEGT